jgi:DNA gyrase subunit A
VVLVITGAGQAHEIPVVDIPESGRSSRGKALHQLLGFQAGARVAALLPISDYEEGVQLVFLTRGGIVKRTDLSEFQNIRAGGINAINLKDDDELLDVRISDGINDIVLATAGGRAIRFPETDVPDVGRNAQGVIGVRMKKGDSVVGMVVVRREATLAVVTANGYAKRTEIGEFRVQGRGGQGTAALSVSEKTGPLVGAKEMLAGDELMVITAGGKAGRLQAAEIPVLGRTAQGKQLVKVDKGDRVVEVSRVASERDAKKADDADSSDREMGDQLELVAAAEGEEE